jgi:hypothetical protein
MKKYLSYTLIFLYSFSTASFSQDNFNFQNLPKATQSVFKQIAAKHQTGPVNYTAVESDTRKSGIDFSNMLIEDAIMMIFMLISEDARKDMKEMLNDMDATRKKKAALRQSEEFLKKQLDSLIKERDVLKLQNPKKYRVDSLVTAKNINQKNGQLQQNSQQQKATSVEETKATAAKAAADIHLRSAEDALLRAKQIRTAKKSQ